MNYLLLIWAAGLPTPAELADLQRDLPGWVEDADRRGARLFGRELDLPQTGATVRVRDGERLVSDGPFAETKEFLAGFDLLDCADPAHAIELAARNPIASVQRLEVCPFARKLRLDESAYAFGRGEDGDRVAYLLSAWVDATGAAPVIDPATTELVEAWREELGRRGLHVFGGALDAPDTATSIRVRRGRTERTVGPSAQIGAFMASIDVVGCSDRSQAIDMAAAHPAAALHAIEVRPFYVG